MLPRIGFLFKRFEDYMLLLQGTKQSFQTNSHGVPPCFNDPKRMSSGTLNLVFKKLPRPTGPDGRKRSQ